MTDRIESKEETSRCLSGEGSRCLGADDSNNGLSIADIERPFDPRTSANAKDAQTFVDKLELAPYSPDGATEALTSMRGKLDGMSETDRLDLLKGIKHFKDKNPLSPFALDIAIKGNSEGRLNVVDVDVTTKNGHHDLLDRPGGKALDRIQELMNKGFQAVTLSVLESAAEKPGKEEEAFQALLDVTNNNLGRIESMTKKDPAFAQRLSDNVTETFRGSEVEGLGKDFLAALNGKTPSAEMHAFQAELESINPLNPGDSRLRDAFRGMGSFALTEQQKESKQKSEDALLDSNAPSKMYYERNKDLLSSR